MSGIAQGIAEWASAAAAAEATDTANTETAKRMIRMQHYSVDEIVSVSTLDKQTVLDLAMEMNITLPAAS